MGVLTNKPTPPVVKEASVWLRNAPRQGMRRMGSGNHLPAMPASTAMNGWTSVTIPWETSAMGLQRVPTALMGNTVMGNAVSSMIQAFLKRVLHYPYQPQNGRGRGQPQGSAQLHYEARPLSSRR